MMRLAVLLSLAATTAQATFDIAHREVTAENMEYVITPRNKAAARALASQGDGPSEACGLCTPADLSDAACADWDITVEYRNYELFHVACGCAKKISGETQCTRLEEDAINIVESFGKTDCGVHLHCTLNKSDPEPLSHKCKDKCLLGLFGCSAVCNTNCYFDITCEALGVTNNVFPQPVGVGLTSGQGGYGDDFFHDDDGYGSKGPGFHA